MHEIDKHKTKLSCCQIKNADILRMLDGRAETLIVRINKKRQVGEKKEWQRQGALIPWRHTKQEIQQKFEMCGMCVIYALLWTIFNFLVDKWKHQCWPPSVILCIKIQPANCFYSNWAKNSDHVVLETERYLLNVASYMTFPTERALKKYHENRNTWMTETQWPWLFMLPNRWQKESKSRLLDVEMV